ncbi:hypothetical protein EDD99_0882 [Streptomyces sp. 846.5]|nr:hypothetical protein EDD99_0882 [Streptomyces sp. 846.5]
MRLPMPHAGGGADAAGPPNQNGGALMGTTTTMRFRNYEIKPDPSGLPLLAAVCVSGEETECGATSDEQTDPQKVGRWIAQHLQDTGHDRYQRRYADYVTAELGGWL